MKRSLLLLSFMVCFTSYSSLGLAVEMTEHEFASLKVSAELQISTYRAQSIRAHLNSKHSSADSARILSHSAGIEKRISAPEETSLEVFDRIRTEADPALQEAMLNVWLSGQAEKERNTLDEINALETLRERQPVVWIPHHEMVHHTMPAFNIALRAQNLVQFRDRQNQARRLVNDFDQLIEAFSAENGSEQFQAAEIAGRQVAETRRFELIRHFQRQLPKNPRAAHALVSLAGAGDMYPAALADVVRLGHLSAARQAIRMTMGRADSRFLAEQALSRPEIGGLAIEAWLESGGDADARLWPLLADPDLGADAANALAIHSGELIERIESSIHQAAPVARLRMLLALKLRNSAASKALLQRLLEAEWLSQQQQMEVASWL